MSLGSNYILRLFVPCFEQGGQYLPDELLKPKDLILQYSQFLKKVLITLIEEIKRQCSGKFTHKIRFSQFLYLWTVPAYLQRSCLCSVIQSRRTGSTEDALLPFILCPKWNISFPQTYNCSLYKIIITNIFKSSKAIKLIHFKHFHRHVVVPASDVVIRIKNNR